MSHAETLRQMASDYPADDAGYPDCAQYAAACLAGAEALELAREAFECPHSFHSREWFDRANVLFAKRKEPQPGPDRSADAGKTMPGPICGECEFLGGGCWRNPHGISNQAACEIFKPAGLEAGKEE